MAVYIKVRELYSAHTSDDPQFTKALTLASRCFNEINQLRDPSSCAPAKKRAVGGGRKSKAPEVRNALFSWFVDVRESLNGRLPCRMFKLKANQMYEEWLLENHTPESEKLKFGVQWIKMWESEYGISLRKPNKRYSIKKEDLVETSRLFKKCLDNSPLLLRKIWSGSTNYQW